MRGIASNRYLTVVALACLFSSAALAQSPTPVIAVPNPPNTTAQQLKHYVVLVSLDGFRYDYPVKYGAPHLLAMGARGASAPRAIAPWPTTRSPAPVVTAWRPRCASYATTSPATRSFAPSDSSGPMRCAEPSTA